MRLESEYRRLGKFWSPDSPKRKVFGILTIKDGGNIQLETLGTIQNFDDEIPSDWPSKMHLGRINGETEGQCVTLDHCVCEKIKGARSFIHVGIAIIGKSCMEKGKLMLNNFCFSIEGLFEWLGGSRIGITSCNSSKFKKIHYQPCEDIVCNIRDGLKINILFRYAIPQYGSSVSEVKMIDRRYFKIHSYQLLPINEFMDLTHKINIFLVLVFGHIVNIKDVTFEKPVLTYDLIFDENINDMNPIGKERKEVDMQFEVYYPSTLFLKETKKITIFNMIFRVDEYKESFENSIRKWLGIYDKSRPAFHLYALAMKENYIKDKFILLTQAIEVYGREMIQASERFSSAIQKVILQFIQIEMSIKKLIDEYSENKKFSDKKSRIEEIIRETRNHYTHHDDKPVDTYVEEHDLDALCIMLEMFIQVFFLRSIGFEDQEIADMLATDRTALGRKYYDALRYINDEMPEADRKIKE